MKEAIESWWFWVFHRKEWKEISRRKIGRRKLMIDCPSSPWVDLIEIEWEHPFGYKRKNKWIS